jgi:hypothetical protein
LKKKTPPKISRRPGKSAKAYRPKTVPGRPTPRESVDALKKRAAKILQILRTEFPGAGTALLHENPFQLLIATILSAQCTDERVNIVTRELFS